MMTILVYSSLNTRAVVNIFRKEGGRWLVSIEDAMHIEELRLVSIFTYTSPRRHYWRPQRQNMFRTAGTVSLTYSLNTDEAEAQWVTPDPSIGIDGHILDAGWHSSLPHAMQTAVSSERCGTAHLPSEALRSRHRCTRQSTLAACTGANRIQDSRDDIQSSPWWRTTLPGAVHLYCWCPWSTGTPVRLSTVGSRACPVAAAQIWNSLPEHIVSALTLQSFRRHLKTFYCSNLFVL